MPKKVLSIGLILIGLLVSTWGMWRLYHQQDVLLNPAGKLSSNSPKLDASAYAFEVLKSRTSQASEIIIDQNLDQPNEQYQSYLAHYQSESKKISAQLNIPNSATPSSGFPVVVMLRGFVDPQQYVTGMGTKNAAAYYASNGFVTLAPDFLGYGQSDPPDNNAIMARLRRPVSVLDLLASLNSLQIIDDRNVMLWGHSNGGQIALSVLEISGKPYPTSLWAPVSKPFPYSILYYTDESEDQGKALRKAVADFEQDHDVFYYSIDRYWSWISAPIQLHQGGVDQAVPITWSNQLVKNLENNSVKVTYYQYPQADHNLRPDWNTVVARDLAFYRSHLQQ